MLTAPDLGPFLVMLTMPLRILKAIAGDSTLDQSIEKSQTAPPSGTSGNSPGQNRLSVACIPRESPPHPDSIATYCFAIEQERRRGRDRQRDDGRAQPPPGYVVHAPSCF